MIFVARLGGGSPVMITARWFDAAFVQHGEEFADPDVVEWRHPSRNDIAISDPLAPCFHPRVSARDDVGLDDMHAGQSPSLYGRRENQRTVADTPYRLFRRYSGARPPGSSKASNNAGSISSRDASASMM